ncbi:MAG: hypothetical protein A2Y53_02075 [Chloroflexi bacterium RBG_16_47_49]|nr:MAG: hypothetical protein A2Y53_02075 [Chloroflexi bacterium RBG_16_47_49]
MEETTNSVESQPSGVKRGKNVRRWLPIALRLVGVGLFLWIISRVDLSATFNILRHVDISLVINAILLTVPIVLIRTWRLRIILNSFGVYLTFPHVLLIRLVGTAAGDMLPGRSGEVVTVAYLQQSGHGLRDPSLTLILDRLFDFVILAIVAIAGLSLFGQKLKGQFDELQGILIISAILFSAIIGILLFVRSRIGWFGTLIRAKIPDQWHRKLNSWLAKANPENPAKQTFKWEPILLVKILGASLLAFSFLIFRGFLLAKATGIFLSLPFLAACMAITTLLQLIPISNVMGIGTREVSLVFLFGLVGITSEYAISFSFMIVFVLLIQDIIGLFLWWRYPVGTKLSTI